MDCTTMGQLYEMSKERGERLLQEQTRWQMIEGAPWDLSLLRLCARLLIRAGLTLQHTGHTVERHTRSPYHLLTATAQELQLSR